MKIIDCDKSISKKNELSIIFKELNKLKNKIIAHPVYLDDNLETSKFVTNDFDEAVKMRSFLYDIDITMACAFVSNHLMRISIIFSYKKKKKTKLIKVIKDFIKESEILFSFLDDIKIKKEKDYYFLDMYKDLQEELFNKP